MLGRGPVIRALLTSINGFIGESRERTMTDADPGILSTSALALLFEKGLHTG